MTTKCEIRRGGGKMPYAVLELVVVVIAEKVGEKLFKMIIK